MEVILFIVVVVIAFYAYRAYMRSKFAGAFNISAVWLKRHTRQTHQRHAHHRRMERADHRRLAGALQESD